MRNLLINTEDYNLKRVLTEVLSSRYRIVDCESECNLVISDRPDPKAKTPRIVINNPVNLKKLLAQIEEYFKKPPVLEFDNFCFDSFNRMLKVRGNEFLLTEKEAQLLEFLLNDDSIPVSKSDLLQKVWGYNAEVDSHTLETHIYRLRQKLEDDPSNPKVLVSDKSGYKINKRGDLK